MTRASRSEPAVPDGRGPARGAQGAVLDAARARPARPVDAAPALDSARAYQLDGEPGELGEVLHVRGAGTARRAGSSARRRGSPPRRWSPARRSTRWAPAGSLYALDRTTGRLTWCDGTGTINYAGTQVSLAAGSGMLRARDRRRGRRAGAGRQGRAATTTGSRSPAITARAATATPAARAERRRAWRAWPGSHRPDSSATWASSRPLSAMRRVGATTRCSSGATGRRSRSATRDGAAWRRRAGGTAAARRAGRAGGARSGLRWLGSSTTIAARTPRAGVRGWPCIAASACTICGPGSTWCSGAAARTRFEYDLVVAPGADVRDLALDFRGGARPQLDGRGGLVIGTRAGILRQPPPVAYQRRAGRRERVPARFRLLAGGGVGFALGAFDRPPPARDRSGARVGIVPGRRRRRRRDRRDHRRGRIRLRGGPDRLARPRRARRARRLGRAQRDSARTGPCGDAFVAKLRPGGTGLVHVTYLSGRREDRAEAIATDPQGNAYVTGFTMSPNFPVANAMQPDWRCGSLYGDAFVVKLAPDGSRMRVRDLLGGCSTFLGEAGRGIAVDAQGRAGGGRAHRFVRVPDDAPARRTATCAPVGRVLRRRVRGEAQRGRRQARMVDAVRRRRLRGVRVRRVDRREGAAGDRRHRRTAPARRTSRRRPAPTTRRSRPGSARCSPRGSRPTARGSTGPRRSAAATGTTGSRWSSTRRATCTSPGADGVERLPDHAREPTTGSATRSTRSLVHRTARMGSRSSCQPTAPACWHPRT